MKVLMLTWEFPPYIAGGLGMACYGLVKSLLSAGTEIDLILPTSEDVFFPLRTEQDADVMPVKYLNPAMRQFYVGQNIENLAERLVLAGVTRYPESYVTPGFSYSRYYETVSKRTVNVFSANIEKVCLYLKGEEQLFKKVQELTARMVENAAHLECDVIHAHDWLTYPVGILLKKMLGKPLVCHIHATEFDRAGGVGDERIHNIEYCGLAEADRVISVSHYTARMIVDRYRIDPRKIDIIHNAYSLSPGLDMQRNRIFKDPLILFLGRITLQKGPDYFVEVADRVLKRFPNVYFVMAGTGDMLSGVLRKSASKRLKERFLFAGFLNREQVERVLVGTDIFVLPSVSEPFGIVPLEAMAFGVATILSKQSGVSEVVKNVFKVDFWDVDKMVGIIVDLLENPEKRAKIAKDGQKEVQMIGWRKAADRVKEVYEGFRCSI